MLNADEFIKSLEMLEAGNVIDLAIRGRSMYPAIKDFDKLRIEPLIEKKINNGDILAIDKIDSRSRTLLIHRLIRVSKQNGAINYYTKGDNATGGIEGPFDISQIKGRVISIRRNGININLNSGLNLTFAPLIALFSLRSPTFLKAYNSLASLIAERKLLFLKLIKRIKNRDPLCFNAQELCILLSRLGMNSERKSKATQLIQEGVRWNSFCDMAINSARPLTVIENLKGLDDFSQIPGFVFERLEKFGINTINSAAHSNAQLLEILKSFSQAQIKAIPLKGVILSRILYNDIASRVPGVDIDLLIKESDRLKSGELLKAMGYQEVAVNEVQAWQWYQDFYRPGFLALDLHWDITMMNRTPLRIDGFWQGAKPAGDEVGYYLFCDEFLMLYLCLNLINSKGYKSLKNFIDIHDLIEKSPGLNWGLIADKALEYNIKTSIFASLIAAKNIIDAPVPESVLAKLKPGILKRLFINIFLSRPVIFEPVLRRKIMEGFLDYIFFELLEASSLREYLKIGKRVFFPPKRSLELSLFLPTASPAKGQGFQYCLATLKRFCHASYKVVKVLLG